MGLKMLDQVAQELDASTSSLVFTNTRAQAELWYQALLDARPDWAGQIALHHASLARATRDWVEQSLKQGTLKAVICTSSLDLGVDFLPVERVLQIGSAKGIARLMQRAGRSGHARGAARASPWCLPTAWNWWRPPPPAQPWPPGISKRAARRACAWTYWSSIWSAWPWAGAFGLMNCSPKSAAPGRSVSCVTASGNGRSISSITEATH